MKSPMKVVKQSEEPFILAIGGSDPSGGAGVQMDLATISACQGYGLSAISSLTVQTSRGIRRVIATRPEDLRDQASACLEDFPVHWIKTGILPSAELVKTVADLVSHFQVKCVVDPIMKSGKGHSFASDETIRAYIDDLCPKAAIVTPNLPEARALARAVMPADPSPIEDPKILGGTLARAWKNDVILKGGHGEAPLVTDLLFHGGKTFSYVHPRRPHKEIHGSGCFFASVITTFCARGLPIPAAVADAEHLLELALDASTTIKGTTFLRPLQASLQRGYEDLLKQEVREVLVTIEKHPAGHLLIPEVRSNISVLGLGGSSITDVAAIDGRITLVEGRPHAAGPIRLGCSNHTARLLLACRETDPGVRAVMNLRYSEANVEACRKASLQCVEIARQQEPSNLKVVEKGTMEWIPSQVCQSSAGFPDVVYDKGDFGKEPMIRLFAPSGSRLAGKLAAILESLSAYCDARD